MKSRLYVFAVSAVLLLAVLSEALPNSSAQIPASGFTVASAVWGTSSSPVEAAPGQQNVVLTVTLDYYYQNTASSIAGTMSLPSGFTDTSSGASSSTAYVSGNIASGTVVTLTYCLDISPALHTGTWPTIEGNLSWDANGSPSGNDLLVEWVGGKLLPVFPKSFALAKPFSPKPAWGQ